MERIRNVGRAATPRALARSGSQREPGARRQRERALGQGGAHGVAQGRLAGIVERGVEGAGGGTGGAGERLPVVVEVGVVDARLERAAGDALQAGAAEPLDEVALAHAGAWLLVGDARVDLTRSAPEVREHLQPAAGDVPHRSEERRVGKECRSRATRYRSKKNRYIVYDYQ